MKKRTISLVLAVVLALGLAAPAMAYTTPDFSDVPSNHWAYEAIMKMADAGVIKGTGNGEFSPEMKLSAEMFVVLVGRVVFPEVKAEGADWSGPYVAEAKAKGLLAGTNVTDATLKGEISRYDMAVILRGAAKQMGLKETMAEASQVTDYGDVPNRYTDAVLTAYGSGLIRGDQTGSFNGTNSMTRQEAATVMSRLIALPEEQAKAEQEEAERKRQEEEQKRQEAEAAAAANRTGEYVTVNFYGYVQLDVPNAPVGLYFKDGRLLGQTVSDESGKWSMDITMDKADYSFTEAWYYAALIGRVTAEKYGREYTFETNLEFVKPKSIMDRTVNFQSGFIASVGIVE